MTYRPNQVKIEEGQSIIMWIGLLLLKWSKYSLLTYF